MEQEKQQQQVSGSDGEVVATAIPVAQAVYAAPVANAQPHNGEFLKTICCVVSNACMSARQRMSQHDIMRRTELELTCLLISAGGLVNIDTHAQHNL